MVSRTSTAQRPLGCRAPFPLLALALAACQGAEAPPAAPSEAPPERAPPSILLISLDTVRADHMALYGGRAACPNIEAVASRGLVYDQAISHFPETQLSHWTMLTGVLPEVHGNVPATQGSAYTGPTLAELVGQAGYTSAAFIGGVTLLDQGCGLSRGFDLYDDRIEPDPVHQRRPAGEISAAARAWIDAQPGPWLAFVHYFDAHFPYTPADPTRYDPGYAGGVDGTDATLAPHRDHGAPLAAADLNHVEALYDAEITELDASLAPLLEGLPSDTVIAITSDHGESFGHGYLFNHRAVLYDSVLHVPLIIAAPGLGAGRVGEQVGLVDLLPTLATAAALPVPQQSQGRPLLRAGPRGALIPASPQPDQPPLWARTDPWMPQALLAARRPDTKVIWDEQGQGQAFDLQADPDELSAGPVPEAWQDAPARYQAIIDDMAPHRQERQTRILPMDPEEIERLRALGYLPPSPGPMGPPGSPGPQGSPKPAAPTNR
jgi:arylsulfatase A-like enzyme